MKDKILHKIRDWVAKIGLGHERSTLHEVADKVADVASEKGSPITTGTLELECGPVTLALGVGSWGSTQLRMLAVDDDEE